MKVIALSYNNLYDLRLLNCENLEEYRKIVDWVFQDRWSYSENDITKYMTREETEKMRKSTQVFDYLKDYDAYWCDFMSIGIDLDKHEIDFFKFRWLLENKFISDESSAISKRIQYRNYKPKKGESSESKNGNIKLKKKYALYEIDENSFYNTLKEGGVIGGNKRNI
ncbi:MAG: Gp15 family bacteriophage protein [Coprobacillaceae bacterium]